MKTETRKVYSRDVWISLPNIIKIDHYNSELYRFKVGAFFETQCRLANGRRWRMIIVGLSVVNAVRTRPITVQKFVTFLLVLVKSFIRYLHRSVGVNATTTRCTSLIIVIQDVMQSARWTLLSYRIVSYESWISLVALFRSSSATMRCVWSI